MTIRYAFDAFAARRDKALAIAHLSGYDLFFPDDVEQMSIREVTEEINRLYSESERNARESADLLRIANAQNEVAEALVAYKGALIKAGEIK